MKKKDFIHGELDNQYLLTDKSLSTNLSQLYFTTISQNSKKLEKLWKVHLRRECNNTNIENLENIIDFTKDAEEDINKEGEPLINKQLTSVACAIKKSFVEYHTMVNKYLSNYYVNSAEKNHPFRFFSHKNKTIQKFCDKNWDFYSLPSQNPKKWPEG